jgi:uncharacterized protein YvpB
MLAPASGPRGEVVKQFEYAKRSPVAVVVVEREAPAALVDARPDRFSPPPAASARAVPIRRSRPVWTARLSAGFVLVAIISSLGGGGLVDSGTAYVLQARAAALHARWADMRAKGIPAADLAELEQQWGASQATIVVGAGGIFWLPGGGEAVGAWSAETDAIWSRDLTRFRSDAFLAEQNLHQALALETFVQRKSRLDELSQATTPLDFATLRDDWMLEAKLVPLDRRIAAEAAAVAAQTQQARQLGIRSDPASDVLGRASAYAELDPLGRMSRVEFLTRSLLSTRGNLQARLDTATTAIQHLQRAADEISVAALYGIDLSGYQARISAGRTLFANALTPAEFNAITADAQQVTAAADHAIYVVLSQTHIVSGVTFIYQNHPLSCEEAATSMALSHQGISVSQDQILNEIGADRRSEYVDAQGRVRWGNPYQTFVGNVNGSESNYTGFGTFYPPLVRVAKAHGANILAYGSMSAATIYARVIAGHPVVAFATWDWRWHPRRDYLSFDGQWIPWIGPVYASHVYTVVGVSPSQVLVNDPIRGQYWISKGAFEAGYSDFNEAIVFA